MTTSSDFHAMTAAIIERDARIKSAYADDLAASDTDTPRGETLMSARNPHDNADALRRDAGADDAGCRR
jgi:hypothetical protein